MPPTIFTHSPTTSRSGDSISSASPGEDSSRSTTPPRIRNGCRASSSRPAPGSVSDKEIQDVIARIEIPGIRSLPGHFREVGASYRGTNPEGTKRWLEIEEHARQAGAPTQPLRSPNTYAKLATITTRTLVVAADADLLAPPALMKLWARHVKGAQWTTVPDAGHSIAWEQPAIFNDIVLKFLKEGRPFGDVPQ